MSLTALQILDFNGQGQPQPSIILNHVLTSRGVWVWIDFPLAICNFQVEKLQWRNNPLHVITCMARGQIPSLISSQIWLFTSCHTYKTIPTFFNISIIRDLGFFFFFFERKFQPMTSASYNSSLLLDQDINRFLVQAGIELQISYSTFRDLIIGKTQWLRGIVSKNHAGIYKF